MINKNKRESFRGFMRELALVKGLIEFDKHSDEYYQHIIETTLAKGGISKPLVPKIKMTKIQLDELIAQVKIEKKYGGKSSFVKCSIRDLENYIRLVEVQDDKEIK